MICKMKMKLIISNINKILAWKSKFIYFYTIILQLKIIYDPQDWLTMFRSCVSTDQRVSSHVKTNDTLVIHFNLFPCSKRSKV